MQRRATHKIETQQVEQWQQQPTQGQKRDGRPFYCPLCFCFDYLCTSSARVFIGDGKRNCAIHARAHKPLLLLDLQLIVVSGAKRHKGVQYPRNTRLHEENRESHPRPVSTREGA